MMASELGWLPRYLELIRLMKCIAAFADLGDTPDEFERFFPQCLELAPDSSVTLEELVSRRDLLRELWGPGAGAAAGKLLGLRSLDDELDLCTVAVRWLSGEAEYDCGTLFRLAVYVLFRQRWRAKQCPSCGRRFVADRPSQRYCSFRCYAAGKLQRVMMGFGRFLSQFQQGA
jgi:hypothetical protein